MTLALVTPTVARAQACTGVNADGCQKATDLYSYMLPQLGLGLAGGNPTLGSSRVLGKLGRVNLGLRLTAFQGSLPKSVNVGTDGTVHHDNIVTDNQYLGGGGVDAAIGLFGGFPLGVTHVGSIDALVSYIYIPDVNNNNNNGGSGGGDKSNIKFETHTKFGFGGRIGLLDESVVVPGVQFDYLRRGLPVLSLTNTNTDGSTIGVDKLDINVSTWRLIATKSLSVLGFSVGIGGDSYKSSGNITAQATPSSATDQVSLNRDISRTNWFGDLTFNLWVLHLGFEYGGVTGGTITTANTFTPAANKSRTYYSFGLRFGS